jgi:multiple sugar transport system permease protein
VSKLHTKSFKESATAYLFLLPGFILFALFIFGPLLYSLRISFFDWNVIRPERSEWIGWENYVRAFTDPIFRSAIVNTIAYTVITVTGQMTFGTLIAVLLNQDIRGRTFFRVAYYLPVITSWVIVSLLFEYMFSGQGGLVNYLLKDILHITSENIRWLADPILAFVPIDLLGIWKGVGWTAIIVLAGLQAIPEQLYEAAEVDGAGNMARFFKITLPLLRPTLVFLLVVLTIGGMNSYVSNLLLTDGGNPLDKTHFILTYMYERTFKNLEFGFGAAISSMLTVFIFIYSTLQIKLLQKPAEV